MRRSYSLKSKFIVFYQLFPKRAVQGCGNYQPLPESFTRRCCRTSVTRGSVMGTEQITKEVQPALCQFMSACNSLLMKCQRLRLKGQEEMANYGFRHISFNYPSLLLLSLCWCILHYSTAIVFSLNSALKSVHCFVPLKLLQRQLW